jgi:integrase
MAPSVRDTRAAYLEQFPARAVTLAWDRPDGALITVRLALTTRESNAVNRHYFNAKIWKPALRAAGIPATRENGCHALRHYYASILFDGGESIRTVSERLGHADPAFTLRTYTHLMPREHRAHHGHHRRRLPGHARTTGHPDDTSSRPLSATVMGPGRWRCGLDPEA